MKKITEELRNKISNIDLGENNIYLLNTLKKLRAEYNQANYKHNGTVKSLINELEKINSNLEKEDIEEETIKELIKEKNKIEKEINKEFSLILKDDKIKKITKLLQLYDTVIKPVLIDNQFLEFSKKGYSVNINTINTYFEVTNVEEIEKNYLESSSNIEKAKDIINTKDLTFNDKVQKIFTTIEKLTEELNVLKELENEELERHETYVTLKNNLDAIKTELKEVKEKILVNMQATQNKKEKVIDELKEEKGILSEFLEFSVERGEYLSVEVINKDWNILKPKINVSLKKIKEKKEK